MAVKTHQEVLEKALLNQEVRQEYEMLKPEFELRRALITLRKKSNLTQQALAELVNTKQEYVSRIEQGHVELSVPYLAKIVKALNADMEIVLRPKDGQTPIITKL
jgi:transcriptional regulator with XRE-family HTH domain